MFYGQPASQLAGTRLVRFWDVSKGVVLGKLRGHARTVIQPASQHVVFCCTYIYICVCVCACVRMYVCMYVSALLRFLTAHTDRSTYSDVRTCTLRALF